MDDKEARAQKLDPDWIAEFVKRDSLLWDSALRTTMSTFLAEYTLHDSIWRGIFRSKQGAAIISLLWDTYWMNGRIIYPEWGGGQFLFLRLCPTRIPIIIPTHRNAVVIHAVSAVLDEDVPPHQRYRTTISFLKGEMELVHEPEVEILCMDWEQQIIPIPMTS